MSFSSRSNSSDANAAASMSFTNPVMQLPHSVSNFPQSSDGSQSAYVNQLYAANLARQRNSTGEAKEVT